MKLIIALTILFNSSAWASDPSELTSYPTNFSNYMLSNDAEHLLGALASTVFLPSGTAIFFAASDDVNLFIKRQKIKNNMPAIRINFRQLEMAAKNVLDQVAKEDEVELIRQTGSIIIDKISNSRPLYFGMSAIDFSTASSFEFTNKLLKLKLATLRKEKRMSPFEVAKNKGVITSPTEETESLITHGPDQLDINENLTTEELALLVAEYARVAQTQLTLLINRSKISEESKSGEKVGL